IGSQNGTDYLVMEYIEGETLASRLGKGPLNLTELLRYSIQLADALDKAHRKGIVHRDLKPGNIMITRSGIKVLDFGLAKLQSEQQTAPEVSSLPTEQRDLTKEGTILGTIQYMAPEQLEGKVIGSYSDVFAMGAIIYEMATGKKAFEGNSQASLIAAILKEEPKSIAQQQPLAPSSLDNIVRTCLAKDPEDRFQTAHDVKLQLQWISELPQVAKIETQTSRRNFLWPVLLLVALLAGSAITWFVQPKASEVRLRKLQLSVPDLDKKSGRSFDISPNGEMIAYISNNRLWIRDLNKLDAREIPNTTGATHPFWSPDNNYIGYIVGRKLWKVLSTGASITAVADLEDNFSGAGGAAWGSDQNIIFSTGFTGLMRVSAQGGDPIELLKVGKDEADFHDPQQLQNGAVMFIVHRLAQGVDTIAMYDGKKRTTILQQPGQRLTNPVYSKTGHILYQRQLSNPGIWAFPFSIEKLQRTGEPFLVVPEGVQPVVSNDGTLVFSRVDRWTPSFLVIRDATGKIVTQVQKDAFPQQLPNPRISPNGNQVILPVRDAGKTNIWLFDLKNETRKQLTFDNISPLWFCAWHPNGKEVVYSSGETPQNFSVWITSVDDLSDPILLIKGGEAVFSPDGNILMYTFTNGPSLDLWYKNLKTGESKPFRQHPRDEVSPEFSPDGKYVAYVSDESRRNEVYISSFPDGKAKRQISFNGGGSPRWSPSGDKLFYVEGNNIMSVPIQLKPVFNAGNPTVLFTREIVRADRAFNYVDSFDVTPDGKHFIMLQDAGDPSKDEMPTLNIVQNWFAEFKNK
ncbi:MAG TPA: protein kinase, partial [Acidobacteriota bacterium]|nr:protein kinase [Acidobacteriota bacterium]